MQKIKFSVSDYSKAIDWKYRTNEKESNSRVEPQVIPLLCIGSDRSIYRFFLEREFNVKDLFVQNAMF